MVDVCREKSIIELVGKHPRGLNIREIAEKLKINRTSVARNLAVMTERGILEYRQMGKARLFYKSTRISDSEMLNLLSNSLLLVNENLEVIRANQPFLSLLGASEYDIITTDIRELDYAIFQDPEFVSRLRIFMESPVRALRSDLQFMSVRCRDTHIITQLIELNNGRTGAILNIYRLGDNDPTHSSGVEGPATGPDPEKDPLDQKFSFFNTAEDAPLPLCLLRNSGEIYLWNRAMQAETQISETEIRSYQGEIDIPAGENPVEIHNLILETFSSQGMVSFLEFLPPFKPDDLRLLRVFQLSTNRFIDLIGMPLLDGLYYLGIPESRLHASRDLPVTVSANETVLQNSLSEGLIC